jgi:3-dehydroquinate synthase
VEEGGGGGGGGGRQSQKREATGQPPALTAEARGVGAIVDAGGYEVRIGRRLLDRLGQIVAEVAPAHRYALVSDSNVMPLYGDRAARSLGVDRTVRVTILAGEAHKSRETWARATDEMLAAGLGRDTTVVALGGGVVGDVAGFVASTYMRGVPVVQVPTSLLAMVDASVGGKTGVDTPAGKNLVGTFHPPAAVVADVSLLASLPEQEFRSGMAEALKHGVIASAEHLRRATGADAPGSWQSLASEATFQTRGDDLVDLIADSVRIKADVVRDDAQEHGKRKVLNFGHTIGHAVELCSRFELLHGEAVAIGMVLEARLGERLGLTAPGTAEVVLAAIRWAGLPESLPKGMSPEQVLAAARSDKKARGGAVEYALPSAIGQMAGAGSGWGIHVPDADVLAVLG